ncbi:MAG: ABC transporter permease [Bacteroidales bacterium]|nr:ABC transporter permease [Bacteroidales bacterium]
MSFERLIAKRFLQKDKGNFSRPLISIATCSIALGILVVVLAVSILRGFQNEITRKIVGFGSHIVVTPFESTNNYYEQLPIIADSSTVATIYSAEGVKHVQFFATKGGMVKTSDKIHGIIFKGIGRDFDSTFFKDNIKKGRLFELNDSAISNEIIVSQRFADKMQIGIGDKVPTYFWQNNNYRARAFKVVGIYSTDLTEFDERYVIGDMRQIQRINGWDSNQVQGYEVFVSDFGKLDRVALQVYSMLGSFLTVRTVKEENPETFSWLDLLNANIFLILSVMALVCVVAVISALLIMIFEKTPMIGLLKTMGATNASIRKIFIYKSAGIIAKGVLAGDAIALAICLLQDKFKIVKLDSESYNMSAVPIDLNPWIFVAVSLVIAVVCILALLIPASYIARIHPAKAVKTE